MAGNLKNKTDPKGNIKNQLTKIIEIIKLIRVNSKDNKATTSRQISNKIGTSIYANRYYIKSIKTLNLGLESKSGSNEPGYKLPGLLTEAEKKELKEKLDKKLFEKIIDLLERVI